MPKPESEIAEEKHWRDEGYEVGLRGGPRNVPVEIRPLHGKSSRLASVWDKGWCEGFDKYQWQTGFASGLEGAPRPISTHGTAYAAWIEGDAKRRGEHYFATPDAVTKSKDEVETIGK